MTAGELLRHLENFALGYLCEDIDVDGSDWDAGRKRGAKTILEFARSLVEED